MQLCIGVDYLSGEFDLHFYANSTQAKIFIQIQDDLIAEGNHDFQVFFVESSFGGQIELYYLNYTTVMITGKYMPLCIGSVYIIANMKIAARFGFSPFTITKYAVEILECNFSLHNKTKCIRNSFH